MTRFIYILLFFTLTLTAFSFDLYSAKILADENGNFMYGENADLPHPLASLTKVMTCLIAIEKIENGEITKYSPVKISQEAIRQRGSKAHLLKDETVTVEDLLKGAIIPSGNDAAYALAEYIGGTVDNFIVLMNKRAAKLGLTHTKYVSPNGLPQRNESDDDMSTARDIAKISAEIVKHPLYMEISSMRETTICNGRVKLFTTNKLLGKYDGVDGLKTGYHDEAKYNVIVSAKQGGIRLFSIVLGAASSPIRTNEAKKLLDHGYENFEPSIIGKKGEFVMNVKVNNGSSRTIDLSLGKDIILMLNKYESDSIKKTLYVDRVINAPVKKGERVATLKITYKDTLIAEYPVVSEKEVKKLNLFSWLIKTVTFNLL